MPAPPNPTPGIANDTASWTELRARAHAHALAAATSALAASVAARNNSQHQLKQHSPPVETTSVSSRQEQLWVPYDEQQHLACTVPARALNASTTQLSDTEASQPTSRSSDSPVPCRAKKKAILGPATTTKTKRCRQRSRPAQDAGLTVWKLTDLCASPTMYVSDSFLDPIVKDDDDDMNGGKKEDGFGRYISGKDRSGNAVAPDGKMVAKKSKFLWMKRPNPRKKSCEFCRLKKLRCPNIHACCEHRMNLVATSSPDSEATVAAPASIAMPLTITTTRRPAGQMSPTTSSTMSVSTSSMPSAGTSIPMTFWARGATTSSDGSCASFSPSLTLDYSLPTGYRLAYPTSPVSTPDAGAFDEDHHVGALLMSEESSRSVVAWEPCDLTPAFVDDLAASFEVSGWMVDPTCGEVEVEETPRCGVGDDFDSIEGASAILANCVAENGPMLLEFVDLRKLITTLHSAPRVLRYASCAYACFFSAAAASRALASAYYKMARVAVFQEPGGDIASTAGLVQALMLLGIYAKANGDSHAASIFNAMAARLSQLRLRDAACGTSAHDLWLQCVCLDNLSAFLTERPAFLPPSDLDVSGTRFLERFASLSSLLQAAREAGSNTRVLAMIERDLECWQAGRTEFGRNCDIAVNEARNDLLDACAGLAAIVLRSSPGRRSAEPTVVEGARRVVAAVTGDAERSSRLAGLARRAGLADLVGLCALRSSSALKTDVEALEGNKTFMELLGCNADWVACVRDMVVEARGRVSLKVEGVWEVTTAAAAEPAVGYKDVVVGGESLMDFCDSLLTFEGVG